MLQQLTCRRSWHRNGCKGLSFASLHAAEVFSSGEECCSRLPGDAVLLLGLYSNTLLLPSEQPSSFVTASSIQYFATVKLLHLRCLFNAPFAVAMTSGVLLPPACSVSFSRLLQFLNALSSASGIKYERV